MSTIVQHVPPIFGGFTPINGSFTSQKELLNIPFVCNFTKLFGGGVDHYFHKFSLDGNKLMVECDKGAFWSVVGYIDDVSNLNLPKWVPKHEENK